MGIYDIAMLLVLGGAIFFGYWKGLAWQIASLAALIVSYIVAVNFRDQVAPLLQVEAPWNQIGAMLILFLGTSLVIWAVYASVAKSLKKHELKGFDRQAGAVLGAAKGALLCMVITMFSVSLLGENVHEAIDHSRLGPYVEKGIWTVSDYVPAELARFVDHHIATYKEAVGHQEPVVDPSDLLRDALGTVYPIEQPLNQDPSKLPPSNQPPFQTQGYQGQWQTPNASASGRNPNLQYGTNYGTQPTFNSQLPNTWNQTNSTGGNQGGFLPSTANTDWSNINISDASRKILEDARRQGIDKSLEAANQEARRLLEGGQPSTARITETAQQILEDARQRGIDMGLEAATEAARRWLEGGQQQR